MPKEPSLFYIRHIVDKKNEEKLKDIVLEKVFSKELLDKSHELYSQVGSPKFNESVIQLSDELQEMRDGKELK